MYRDEFNPLARMFKSSAGKEGHEEVKDVERASLHNEDLYDEEGEAHGGEAVNPETGSPNRNRDGEPDRSSVTEREVDPQSSDVMGDVKDPGAMSLEELMETQGDDI